MATFTPLYASKETFLLTGDTVRIRIDARSVPTGQPQQVAHALANDLLYLLPRLRLDLAAALGVPSDEYLPQGEDLVEEICDDLERLLRYRLLTSVTLLLCHLAPDPATGGSVARYICDYALTPALPGGPDSRAEALRSLPTLDQLPFDDLRPALVVQWDSKADWQTRAQLRRPHYNFDWSTPLDPSQPATVVRFSELTLPIAPPPLFTA
jgi:hypothetical protein